MEELQKPQWRPTADNPVSHQSEQYLTDGEINEFLNSFNTNTRDGSINYDDLEQQLDLTHGELVQQSNAHGTTRRKHDSHLRHAHLRSVVGSSDQYISREVMTRSIRSWRIPSLLQVKKRDEEEQTYFTRRNKWRMFRAYWAVHGHEVVFISLVVAMQVTFGVLELVKYRASHFTSAFGWGVVVAKACTGALYPTFFFMMLSMSRYFSTMLRRSYRISRFFNLDLSNKFHISFSCVALLLATIHAVSHLTGTFVQGSDPANTKAVDAVAGHKIHGRGYVDYIRSTPGVTGLFALGLFYILSLLSLPKVRKWNYNIFQLGHLLVYPITGLMMAHGTAALLQQSIFGYVLAFPTFLVLFERLSRVFLGFYHVDATLEILTDDTVEITAVMPKYRLWDYTAGQYILLQVPSISFFQWHPFTISFCHGKTMKLHIKTDGDWTSKLRELGPNLEVGINGPFGAPAQRFYDFQYSIIIGAGIGITPFSAILADLQHKDDLDHGGPGQRDASFQETDTAPDSISNRARTSRTQSSHHYSKNHRRTDFHWIVRDGNSLLWLSNLLNRVSRSQKWHRERRPGLSHLDIRINTHVTAKRSNIATYIYSWLLETDRSEAHPESSLTGLLNPTRFGRPDFDKILDEHYDEMRKMKTKMKDQKNEGGMQSPKHRGGKNNNNYYRSSGPCRVGVFYCGAAAVGEILADKCSELTIRSRDDGTKIEYHFIIEVFS